MIRPKALFAALAVCISGAFPAQAGEVSLLPVPYAKIQGWQHDNHREAFRVFLKSCPIFAKANPARSSPRNDDIRHRSAVCAYALRNQDKYGKTDQLARSFFEKNFQPFAVRHAQTAPFFTAYFEPVLEGSRHKTSVFSKPLLLLPEGNISQPRNTEITKRGLTAGLRTKNGTVIPYPDRAAIEKGALKDQTGVLVWLDPVDAFFTHIQGSARVHFADGSDLRVAFAGRNGHPYTPIGKVLVERGIFKPEEVTLETLKAWLRAHPKEGAELMHKNQSYIFFKEDVGLKAHDGPRGAAGIPLSTQRSLAIDPAFWQYGLPVWVQTEIPVHENGKSLHFNRLMIAQDTGAAIKGAGRSDIFWGTGGKAGIQAGKVRHEGEFIVLLPKVRHPQ